MDEETVALYEQELAALEALCRDFIRARDELEHVAGAASALPDAVELLICGMLIGQCAKVYNLAPPGGFLDPRSLFTGKPE
jgi:hypothetical protein